MCTMALRPHVTTGRHLGACARWAAALAQIQSPLSAVLTPWSVGLTLVETAVPRDHQDSPEESSPGLRHARPAGPLPPGGRNLLVARRLLFGARWKEDVSAAGVTFLTDARAADSGFLLHEQQRADAPPGLRSSTGLVAILHLKFPRHWK